VPEPTRNKTLRAINGHCVECGYRLAWILVRGRRLARRIAARLVVHRAKTLWLPTSRNVPKRHYYRLYRAGVVISVVAQQIQDMSAMSITHKTVGIGLPRLWCGTIALHCSVPADHQKRCLLRSPFCTWRGRIGVFESARKTEHKDPVDFIREFRG
jgi:hypothetical protein